jgi:undecaprenyl-diphosphatase
VGIPTMLVAGAYEGLKAIKHPEPGTMPPDWAMLALAMVVSAVVSFAAVKWLLRFVQSHTFIGFGIYRIVFGVALLWLLHGV